MNMEFLNNYAGRSDLAIEDGDREHFLGQDSDGDVLNQLYELRGRVHAMGANDHELVSINELINRYNEGELTGEEALRRTHGILDFKSQYH